MTKFILKIAISLILLYLVLHNVKFEEFVHNLLAINIYAIIGSLSLLIVQTLFVSGRWKSILDKIARPLPYLDIIEMHYMSLSLSLFLPNIVAEPAIKSFLMKKYNVTFQNVLISVVLDKLFVVTGLFLMTLVVMPIIFVLYKPDRNIEYFYIFTVIISILLFLFIKSNRNKTNNKILNRIKKRLPLAYRCMNYLYQENILIRRCLIITLASQISAILAVYILSSQMEYNLTIFQCLLLMPPVMLVTTVPVAFNGWGVRELAMIYILKFVNIPSGTALALSIQFGIIGILLWSIGIIFWIKFKI